MMKTRARPLQLEKARTAMKTQHSHKLKNENTGGFYEVFKHLDLERNTYFTLVYKSAHRHIIWNRSEDFSPLSSVSLNGNRSACLPSLTYPHLVSSRETDPFQSPVQE